MPVLNGKAYWAKVYPGQHDEGNPKMRIGPSYNLSLVLSDESLKVAEKEGYDIKEPSASVPGKFIVAKSKITDKMDQPPRVVDENKNPYNKNIGNGQEMNISVHSHEWQNPNGSGVTAILRAIQVLPPYVEFGGGVDDFEVVGDGEGKDFDDNVDDDFA